MHTLQTEDIEWLYSPYKLFGELPSQKALFINEKLKVALSKWARYQGENADVMLLKFQGQSRLNGLIQQIRADDIVKAKVIICGKLSGLPKRNKGLIYEYMKDIEATTLEELYYKTFMKLIQDYGIKLIFMTGDGSIIERCAILAAHHSDIYTMLHPHGYISPIVTNYEFHKKSRCAVFGQEQEDILLENGYKKEQIRQTGAMWFP